MTPTDLRDLMQQTIVRLQAAGLAVGNWSVQQNWSQPTEYHLSGFIADSSGVSDRRRLLLAAAEKWSNALDAVEVDGWTVIACGSETRAYRQVGRLRWETTSWSMALAYKAPAL